MARPGAPKVTCGNQVWRCNLCGRAVAAGKGNTRPQKCGTKTCDGQADDIHDCRPGCTNPPAGHVGGCHQSAGFGTDHSGEGHCRYHGGTHPRAAAAAKARLEIRKAREECERLGIHVEIDPGEALIRAVWEAAGNVEFYRSRIQELVREDLNRPTFHISGQPTGETVQHPFLVLYNQERDRLVAFSTAALKAGVDERRVRLAEADAQVMFGAVMAAMREAGITDAQQEAIRSGIADNLRAALPAGVS